MNEFGNIAIRLLDDGYSPFDLVQAGLQISLYTFFWRLTGLGDISSKDQNYF